MIILIDFKNTSEKELKLIVSKTNLKHSYLIELRDEYNVERVIVDVDQMMVLAYKYYNADVFSYNDDVFETIKPFKVEVPKEIVLGVDTILEKISKFGMDSLSDEEKEFLDNSNE